MFRQPTAGIQPMWKRPVYLICTTILGAMLGLLGEVMWYAFFSTSKTMETLIPLDVLHIFIIIILAIGGFFVGKMWWTIVYVERRWAHK